MRQSFHKCLVHVPDIGDTAANKTDKDSYLHGAYENIYYVRW